MSTKSTAAPSDSDAIGYADAVTELEGILTELEAEDVDVDRLAEHVRRAADLIELCRGRLDDARVEVTRIVADLDALETDTTENPDDAG
jgi:exodeoxyribonuclease VII small subunit